MTAVAYQSDMLPAAGVSAISTREANRLLVEWGHYLGPCDRPFGIESWLLEAAGRPISVAVSASIVGPTAAGLPCREVGLVRDAETAPGLCKSCDRPLPLSRITSSSKQPVYRGYCSAECKEAAKSARDGRDAG